MKGLLHLIFPQNRRIGFLSAVCAVLAAACTAFARMRVLYQRVPQYEELVAGYTSWNAYFKQGDMALAHYVVFGVTGFYFLFSALFQLLSKKIAFLGKESERRFLTGEQKNKLMLLTQLFYLLVFTQFSWGISGRGLSILFPSLYGFVRSIFFPVQILLALFSACLWFSCLKRESWKWFEKGLFISQLFLPLVFLELTRFEYEYKGELLLQYVSEKFIFLGAACSLIFIGSVFYQRRKSPEVKIYLSSFLSLAVFASYLLPKGTISGAPLEFYHYGELSVPLHQLLYFGTIPYLDTMPIHGACDYFQGAVWYLFFDGTYASFEAAMVIGCVAIAVITAAVFYYSVENKAVGILCILWFSLFGDQYYYVRWAFVLPFILIAFSKKSREDFARLFWSWVFLSVLSIAWNPSIGGTCALAALPFVLYEAFHEKGYLIFVKIWKIKEYRKKWLPLYGFLLVFGICFVPMFFEILRYISENSVAILETTGDILKEELAVPYVWYATFGFVLPLLSSFYFCIQKKGEERKIAVFGALFLFLFNAVIVRYTFVRTQFGERGIIAVTISSLFFVLMVLLPCVKLKWEREAFAMLVFLLFVTGAAKGADLRAMPERLLARDTIPREYEYVRGGEIGIPALGDIFMEKGLKEEFISLNHVANELCADGYQFVDMTNQLSHYVILNKEVLLPFSSTYNTNNEIMQTKAIQVLNERKPEVIVVSPAWRHDAATLSIRNYHLYQWLMQHGYVPCKYESVLFLTNQPEIQERYAPAYEELGQQMHLEMLRKLPAVWAGQELKERSLEEADVKLELVDTNSQVLSDGVYQVDEEDTFFFYNLEEPVSGKEIDFLRIRSKFQNSGEALSYQGVVYFIEEGKGLKESKRFIYDGGADEVVIPLSTSPYWSYSEKNQMIMVDLIGSDIPGTQLSLELGFERYIGPGRDNE